MSMETLTEDHLIYHIASYLRVHEMIHFVYTSKRYNMLLNSNDKLWMDGGACKLWPWRALKITKSDMWGKKSALDAYKTSSTPYRDLYRHLTVSEHEFIRAYLSLFASTPASSSGNGRSDNIDNDALYEWSIMIDGMIFSADVTALRMYHKILVYFNYRQRGIEDNFRSDALFYSERILRIIEKFNLKGHFDHFLHRARLSSACLTRHLSLISYSKNRIGWMTETMRGEQNEIDPLAIMRGQNMNILYIHSSTCSSIRPKSIHLFIYLFIYLSIFIYLFYYLSHSIETSHIYIYMYIYILIASYSGLLILSSLYLHVCPRNEMLSDIYNDPDEIFHVLSSMRQNVFRAVGVNTSEDEVEKCLAVRRMDKMKVLRAINKIFFEQFAFKPVANDNYYKIENSFIHLVVKRRTGSS